MNLVDYQELTQQVNARSDLGVVAKLGEDGVPVQQYEILLVRKDNIIVRAVGPRRSTTPMKIVLPLTWDANGHTVDGVKYKFLQKKGAEVVPTKVKSKKGPKREGPTKLDKCRAIWDANPNVTATDMKAKFVSEAECTPAGANTYYLLIRNQKAEKKEPAAA